MNSIKENFETIRKLGELLESMGCKEFIILFDSKDFKITLKISVNEIFVLKNFIKDNNLTVTSIEKPSNIDFLIIELKKNEKI